MRCLAAADVVVAASFLLVASFVDAFGPTVVVVEPRRQQQQQCAPLFASTTTNLPATRPCRARDLIRSLVEDEACFATERGAKAFGEVCALNIVYEDRFEPQPLVGRIAVIDHLVRRVELRGGGDTNVRIDKISDGNKACGFAWTWTCGSEEGLRGTTYVELNDQGEIQYVQEIPEPLYKPGDLTLALLKALTADAEWKPPQPLQPKTPTIAHELTKYLFVDLQNADKKEGTDELMRFFDEKVIYRDFNYEDVLRGPDQVRKFVYVRDVAESAIKPPILGKLARQFRPGLGVFSGIPLNGRPGGM
jgi:hypothetical protein